MLAVCIAIKLYVGRSKVANMFRFCAGVVSLVLPKTLLDEHRQNTVHRKHKYLTYFDFPLVFIYFYNRDKLSQIGMASGIEDQIKIEICALLIVAFLANIYLALALVIATLYLGLVFVVAPIYLI
jgi:hypothetical protein